MRIIRLARISDASDLAKLVEATFRDTFAQKNTPENMDSHCLSSYGNEIQGQEIVSSKYVTFVAEIDSKLVAYAQLRWSDSPSCVSANSPGEIHRLYVDKNFHGKGLAHNLMSECLKVFEERNTDIAWLGVWEENSRAIAFYKKFNFEEAGEHVFSLGSDPQRDIILVRPVKNFE